MALYEYSLFKIRIDPGSKKRQGLHAGDVVRRQYADGAQTFYSLMVVLATGEEVLLDQVQGNAVNSFGVTTAINVNGWRTWGNNSAIYPASTDPKDRWFCCRRFFSWWGNSFILTYFQR